MEKAIAYLSEVSRLAKKAVSLRDKRELLNAGNLRSINYELPKSGRTPEHSREALYVKLIEVSREYREALEQYRAAVQIRKYQIAQLENPNYERVLLLRYVTGSMTLAEIARELDKTSDGIWHIHKRALEKFEQMFLD